MPTARNGKNVGITKVLGDSEGVHKDSNEVLQGIHRELKLLNAYLKEIAGCEITYEDLEEDDY